MASLAFGKNERGRTFLDEAPALPDLLTQLMYDAAEEFDALQEIVKADVLVRTVRV